MLKTKCKDCTFLEVTCSLDRKIYIGDSEPYAEGYCRFKRNNKWRMEKDSLDQNSLEFLAKSISKEECSLCIVIICINNDVEKLNKTIDSIKNYSDLVKQVIVVLNKANKEQLTSAFELLSYCGFSWNLENMKGEELYTLYGLYDYVSTLAKTHWITCVHSGYNFKDNDLDTIENLLSYDDSNYVCFYSDDYCISNVFAFHELGGNYELSWLEKVKTFSNWEKICRKLD